MTLRGKSRIGLRLGILFSVALWIGCGHPVGVRPLNAREVHRALISNVLTTGELSARSQQLLERTAALEQFRDDPESTLAVFHTSLATGSAQHRRFVLFPMAELSFYYAEKSGKKEHYLAAAFYAYSWLFGQAEGTVSDPLDPHIRLAANLYNQAIVAVFRNKPGDRVLLVAGDYPLPFGSMEIEITEEHFERHDYVYEDFRAAAELGVTGLRNRFRRAGIGAPLAARLRRKVELGSGEVEYFSRLIRLPITAFLRIEDPVGALSNNRIHGRIELYSSAETEKIDVDGRRIQLEYETTASLAYGLADDSAWNFEITGFLSSRDEPEFQPLTILRPYQPGKVPLVLVHGTASSPARWADLVNELYSESWFRRHFQIWVFRYDTGNPVAYSAGILRETLEEIIDRFDPNGEDDALKHMVVVGHSQGGLLTKMTAIESGDRFWDNLSPVPFWKVNLSDEVRRLLERSIFFTPLP
ncbi:MAG TPA: hypothetical protein EYQ46_19395, partial [Myxococcales bacterium]|nr:hypothetical protein [Myxococcales bacterium]